MSTTLTRTIPAGGLSVSLNGVGQSLAASSANAAPIDYEGVSVAPGQTVPMGGDRYATIRTAAPAEVTIVYVEDPVAPLGGSSGGGSGGGSVGALVGPRFSAAIAAMRAGTRDARILCVGDSTTAGYHGGTLGSGTTYPNALARLLAAQGMPSAPGFLMPPTSLAGTTFLDSRWNGGSHGQLGGANASSVFIAPGGANVVVTPGVYADAYDVYTLAGPDPAAFALVATGGASVTTPLGGAVRIAATTVAAGSASAANSITLSNAGGGGGYAFCVGVVPRLAGTKQALVGNAGASASRTTDWTAQNSGADAQTGPGLIRALAPDLTLLMIEVNDASAPLSVADHLAGLAPVAAAAALSGDVALLSAVPSQTGSQSALEGQYAAALPAFAAAHGYRFVDLFGGLFAGAYQPSLMSDDLHPGPDGYALMAAVLAPMLRVP